MALWPNEPKGITLSVRVCKEDCRDCSLWADKDGEVTSKLYQVFISATYHDLVEERRVVLELLPQMGCMPILLPSQGPQAWPSVRKRIEAADYYFLLVGSRYGSLTPSGVSHTHQEFVHARHKKKPMLICRHAQPSRRPEGMQETTAEGRTRFQDFCQLLDEESALVWQDTTDLARVLRSKVPAWIQAHPAEGWVRASSMSATQILGRAATREDPDLDEALARIAELEAERDQWLSGLFKPSELAQGLELTDVHYQANVYHAGHCELLMLRSNLSWNEIFLAMAPHMRQPQTERFMQDRLADFLRQRGLIDAQKQRPKAHAMTDIKLSDLSFTAIRIQLRTLGLIGKARFVQKLSGIDTLWQLTLQGEYQVNRLLLRNRAIS